MKTIEEQAKEYIGYLGANVLHQQQSFLAGAKAQRDIVIEELDKIINLHTTEETLISLLKFYEKLKSQK